MMQGGDEITGVYNRFYTRSESITDCVITADDDNDIDSWVILNLDTVWDKISFSIDKMSISHLYILKKK